MMSLQVESGHEVEAAATALQEDYPAYTFRTNREQLQAVLSEQAVVLASGAGLIALAIVAGVLLLLNLQLSFVNRHRETFGALAALGTSHASLGVVVLTNTIVLGVIGGLVGILLAVPSLWGVNQVAAALSGFEGVVSVTPEILLGGSPSRSS